MKTFSLLLPLSKELSPSGTWTNDYNVDCKITAKSAGELIRRSGNTEFHEIILVVVNDDGVNRSSREQPDLARRRMP